MIGRGVKVVFMGSVVVDYLKETGDGEVGSVGRRGGWQVNDG